MVGNAGGNAKPNQIGPWQFLIALLGIMVGVLFAFVFQHLFATAGDVVALFSYIAAIVGAVFGVQITVWGAQATADNKSNRQKAKAASEDLAALENDLPKLLDIVRTIGVSPAGSRTYHFIPNAAINLPQPVEITPDELENVRARLMAIRRALTEIARE